MKLRGKIVEDLTDEDISSLIENKIPESKILDYKKVFKLDLDQDRAELLFDITAFYNTEGGVLIFGLEEEKDENGKNTGIPKLPEKNEQVIDNYEKMILAIEECIKNNTNPQLSNLHFSKKILVSGCPIFAIGVPKNSSLPVMVTYKNSSRFYKRRNTGKYQLDTYELYNLFLKSMDAKEKAKKFIDYRKEEFLNQEFLIDPLHKSAVLVHIMPLSNTDNEEVFDIANDEFISYSIKYFKPPLYQQALNPSFTFDGLYLFYEKQSYYGGRTDTPAYNLIFRDGCIEMYTYNMIKQDEPGSGSLYYYALAKELRNLLIQALSIYKIYEVEPPYAVSLTLKNMNGLALINSKSIVHGYIKRKNLDFPIFLIINEERDIHNLLINIFNIIFQSAGIQRCPDIEAILHKDNM